MIRILEKTTELLFLSNLCNIRTYRRMCVRELRISNLSTKYVSCPHGPYRTVPYKKKPKKSNFAGYPCTVPYLSYLVQLYNYFFMGNQTESNSSGTFYLHTSICTILFYGWIKLSTKRQI